MYNDIGSDTFKQYYPKYVFNLLFGTDEGNSGYSLQKGLGDYVVGAKTFFYTPFNFVFLFMNTERAFIASTFLKMIWTAVFAWLFMKKRVSNSTAAFMCSVMTAFGSFFVLWGQHYNFAADYAYFISVLYFVQLLIERKRAAVFLTAVLAFLTYNSYYFTWMIGIFCVGFVVADGIAAKRGARHVLKTLLFLALAEGLAVCIASPRLFYSIREFINSKRDSSALSSTSSILSVWNAKTLVACLGRFFSNDFWGVGSDYSAKTSQITNYYEMAQIFTSNLAIVAFAYNLRKRKFLRAFLLPAAAAVLLCVRTFSFVLVLAYTYRWTYLLNVVVIIYIGLFLAGLFRDIHHKKYRFIAGTVILADIIFAVSITCTVLLGRAFGFDTNRKAVLLILALWACINFILLLLIRMNFMTTRRALAVLCLFVCVEQVAMNYDSVNDRKTLSVSDLENDWFYDETKEAVSAVEDADSSLYRMNKADYDNLYNSAYIQGFYGTGYYDSTINENAINLTRLLAIKRPHSNSKKYMAVGADSEQILAGELLSVKYIISDDEFDTDGSFTEAARTGDVVVYRDEDALPFGYLYTTEISKKDYKNLEGTLLRSKALMLGFYYTHTDDSTGIFKVQEMSGDLAELDWEKGRSKLAGSAVSEISFSGSTYRAKVQNDTDANMMLCVPLVYDSCWRVKLNGESVECENINGGLVGVVIEPGEYDVEIEYSSSLYDKLGCVSKAAIVLYACVLCMFLFVRLRMRGKVK